jgi:diketogulonate reductase-like aldo/keto reductase
MRSRSLGPTGQTLPIVGQGTWNLERVERRAAIAALRAGLDAGMTHIDTAELYGDGRVEHIVGEALAGRRDECVIVSKVLPQHADRSGTLRACDRSLARLGFEHLDGYLLHWSGAIPLAETVEVFERLREQGKIRWWGVSNFDERQMEDLVALAGAGAIACNQVLYHLRERSIEHAVLPYCHGQGIAVVGYSPFGSGEFPAGRAAAVLEEVAARHGATPRQVALAFLVREPATFAIPRTGRADHARENAAAGDLELSAEDVAAIDRAFPRGPRRPGVPTI